MEKDLNSNPSDEILSKYESRAKRMIGRWAGIRGPARKNQTPTEGVHTREQE